VLDLGKIPETAGMNPTADPRRSSDVAVGFGPHAAHHFSGGD
jgi:hypothetical protein